MREKVPECILPQPLFCRRIPHIEELEMHSCPGAAPHLLREGVLHSAFSSPHQEIQIPLLLIFPSLPLDYLLHHLPAPHKHQKAFAVVSLKRTLKDFSNSFYFLPILASGYSFPLPSLDCVNFIENVAFSLEEDSDRC